MSMNHIFSGNPLNRGEVERRDDQWLANARNHPGSLFLAFDKLNVLIDQDGPSLRWLSGDQLPEQTGECVLLGLQGDVAHFAIDVTGIDEQHPTGGRFTDCRAAAMGLPLAESGIVAQARANLNWHRQHRFCGACGAATQMQRGGQTRQCPSCNAQHFPRTDPVAIMLIVDGDRCLMGQPKGPLVRTGIYSALAGFVDQGESIEEAVRREIGEEAGIEVGDVRYHSSQPWPFVSSLMIGCHGKAVTTDINMDTEEMHDVRWFERQDILDALAGSSDVVKVPGEIAIAHYLVRDWAEGRVEF